MDYAKIKEVFDNYVDSYENEEMILLKKYHSYAVSDLMAELAYRLKLSDEQIILAKVIGLLHDIGRFEQYKKYKSYNDKNGDHAVIGCKYLFEEGHIRDYITDPSYDEVINKAIRYHNTLKLPNLDGDVELFSKMIRDMDKVDIYKQMAIHSHAKFDAKEVSEKVLGEFKKEKTIDLGFVKSKSDAIITRLAFIFDFNFNESFDILVDTDNFDLYLSVIEVTEDSEKLWRKIREECFDKINRGVKVGGNNNVRKKI